MIVDNDLYRSAVDLRNALRMAKREPTQYAVEVAPQVFYHVKRQPNAWWRWWQYVLLGWNWSKLP